MKASLHYEFTIDERKIHLYVSHHPFKSGWTLLPTVEQFLTFVKSDTRRQDELDQTLGNLYQFLNDALNAVLLAEWGYHGLNCSVPKVVTLIDESGPKVCLVWRHYLRKEYDYGVMFVASRVAIC